MGDSFRTTPSDQSWSGANPAGGANGFRGATGPNPTPELPAENAEVGKALLVGLLGGLVSAAGYLIYRRLPDEQKERINTQVRTLVQQRITEIRQNFNI
jgi:hypothetical protein